MVNNPFNEKKEPINHKIFQQFIESIDWLAFTNQFLESCHDKIWKNIRDKIEKQTPELLTNFELLYRETTQRFDHYEKEFNKMDRKVKKCVDSTSIYHDVYKLKDELKKLKDMQHQYRMLLRSLLKAARDEEEALEEEFRKYGYNDKEDDDG